MNKITQFGSQRVYRIQFPDVQGEHYQNVIYCLMVQCLAMVRLMWHYHA
jgi:hypothetical protein